MDTNISTNSSNNQYTENTENFEIVKDSQTPDIDELGTQTNRKKMVFGLDPTLLYNLALPGSKDWKTPAAKVLKHFNNPVLVAASGVSANFTKWLHSIVGTERLYIDSGGYNLYRKQLRMGADSAEFKKCCEKMKNNFLRIINAVRPVECFELDNDYFKKSDDLLSDDNFLRKEVYQILGYYPTPVFKMHQGFEYWKALCDSPKFPKLSIGGLAHINGWKLYGEELKVMVDYAHTKGKKVHFLGGRNLKTFRMCKPDTIDYCIFFLQICFDKLRQEHPELNDAPFPKRKIHLGLWAFALALRDRYMYDNEIAI